MALSASLPGQPVILGFDPGRQKCGLAVMGLDRCLYYHEVVPAAAGDRHYRNPATAVSYLFSSHGRSNQCKGMATANYCGANRSLYGLCQ